MTVNQNCHRYRSSEWSSAQRATKQDNVPPPLPSDDTLKVFLAMCFRFAVDAQRF